MHFTLFSYFVKYVYVRVCMCMCVWEIRKEEMRDECEYILFQNKILCLDVI